ncbi:hypothetical protein SAMN05660816_05798 [Niastella yeongjuensis]|nr:hypothetical protein SAMN05660816_05798 [Niastella yeongjuensis]
MKIQPRTVIILLTINCYDTKGEPLVLVVINVDWVIHINEFVYSSLHFKILHI